jgi:Uma2 family endonuclease
MVLHGISWRTYESLLADHAERSAPRFTYDRGTLEIMPLTASHEEDNRVLHDIVSLITAELGIEILNVGSTTYHRSDLEAGFEADTAFYVQHEAQMRGRRDINPAIDPPPDLVIEVDATRSSLDKLSIYARFGVPEVWRTKDGHVQLYHLTNGSYVEADTSKVIPHIMRDMLERLLSERRSTPWTEWVRAVRAWAREQADAS